MKLPIFTGLVALQLAVALTASAQNFYVKISGDQGTRIADHASWQQGPIAQDHTLEAYNLKLAGTDNAVGLMRFLAPAGMHSWATHYRLNVAQEKVMARRILTPEHNRDLHVIGERYDASGSTVKSAVILEYDQFSGLLLSAYELPALPLRYQLLRVFDVITELGAPDSMRILCLVSDGRGQSIMELKYNKISHTYTAKNFKPYNLNPDRYLSAYYIRTYHYGAANLGEVSFYGLATYGSRDLAYCYTENKFETYDPQSSRRKGSVTGVQMNGSYGVGGTLNRIDMAFIDSDGNLCIQQKDGPIPPNWRRFYAVPGGKFEMGYGRDGHGTKQGGGMDYFMAAIHLSNDVNPEGHVTSLHYNALNGNLDWPNVYNFSGIGVLRGGGFPNTTNDPGYDYTFIADRFNLLNGFKFGTGNATTRMRCTETVNVNEFSAPLKEVQDTVRILNYRSLPAQPIDMVAVNDITVSIVPECNTEQRGTASSNNLLQDGSKMYMDATQLRLEASGKTITAMRVLAIDGRLIAEQRNLNSSRYEQYFNTPLTPGIYVISLEYTDHSRENRKISIH